MSSISGLPWLWPDLLEPHEIQPEHKSDSRSPITCHPETTGSPWDPQWQSETARAHHHQPVSVADPEDGKIFALMVVPSISPDIEDIGELARFSVKFLPDCEITKPAS